MRKFHKGSGVSGMIGLGFDHFASSPEFPFGTGRFMTRLTLPRVAGIEFLAIPKHRILISFARLHAAHAEGKFDFAAKNISSST